MRGPCKHRGPADLRGRDIRRTTGVRGPVRGEYELNYATRHFCMAKNDGYYIKIPSHRFRLYRNAAGRALREVVMPPVGG